MEHKKLNVRERIDILLDKGTFVEVDKYVKHHCTNFGMENKRVAGDGVVCGYGKIDGRVVFVYGFDFAVMGGSLSAANAAKIAKVQDAALRNGAPIIGLNDSGGARIQEGIESLSGFGDIFYRNVMASGVIPQISAIMGPCAGGSCYSPALTDFILMVRDEAQMFITGPNVVKQVTQEECDKESLGGADVHSSKSGVCQFVCESDEECLMTIRELIGFLPNNNMEDAPALPQSDDRRSIAECSILYFGNLGSIGSTERTAHHGKIKAIDKDQTTVDLAITAHHAIAGYTFVLHAEIGAVMLYIFVYLNESAFVEENIYSFTNV